MDIHTVNLDKFTGEPDPSLYTSQLWLSLYKKAFLAFSNINTVIMGRLAKKAKSYCFKGD